jgi:hypothetical protein
MLIFSILTLASLALSHPTIKRAEPAALLEPQGEIIPGKYIVRMKDTADISTFATYEALHTYNSKGFKGFAAELDNEKLETIRNNPDVSALRILLLSV